MRKEKLMALTFLILCMLFALANCLYWSYGTTLDGDFDSFKALDFLESLYDKDQGLLPEYNGSKNYWVYNDNALAYQILLDYSRNETAGKIGETIKRYSENKSYNVKLEGNDRVEVLFNRSISYSSSMGPFTGSGYHYSPIVNHDMKLGNNSVFNPSVEIGSWYPDDWYHSDPNLIKTPWSTRYKYDGNKSIGLTITSEDADWRSKTFAVEPLKHYMITCYVYGDVKSGDWFFKIRWFNSSDPDPSKYGVGENFTQISPGNYTEWAQETLFDFTCPSEASYADVLFMAKNGTGELYTDDFEVGEIIESGTFIVRNDRKYMQIPDWQSYSDLLAFGILDRYYKNDPTYLKLWENLTAMCKPEGLEDKAFNSTGRSKYDTYKVALALIVGKIIGAHDIPYEQEYAEILCEMQQPNGGVRTHYLQGIIPDPEAKENVETTCLAIYAIMPKENLPTPWIIIPEFQGAIMLLTYIILSVTIVHKKNIVKSVGKCSNY
jgi:hypothetical protein